MPMRLACLWSIAVTAAVVPAAAAERLSWSSDGRWLAYRAVVDDPGPVPKSGWLFRAGLPERVQPLTTLETPENRRKYRIYVADRAGSHLVASESGSPLTSPCWDAVRGELAFGRLLRGPERFELGLFRRGFDPEPEAVGTLTSEQAPSSFDGIRIESSADGRFLAVARSWIPDVVILRADNGRRLKTLPAATRPSWSRDGSRLAYLSGGEEPWLYLVDAGFGPARMLAGPVAPVDPRWSRDGESLLVVMSRKLPPPAVRGEAVELVRVAIESRATETVAKLGTNLIQPPSPAVTPTFTMSPDGDDLFSAMNESGGKQHAVVWMRPKVGETLSRFHPLDVSVEIDALELSPDGTRLAARYGTEGVVGISEPGRGDVLPLVPDESARLAWVRLLVETGRRLVHLALPPAAVGGKAVIRPTIIPVPGEVAANAEIGYRLRRIARVGLPLARGGRSHGRDADPFFDEATLFFEFLLEDWASATRTLDSFEEKIDSPEDRLKLLGLRAQIAMGQGDLERASDGISYLAALDGRPRHRLEETTGGSVLVEEPTPLGGWPSYLKQRLDALAAGERGDGPAGREPLGHRNPDNPNDGRPTLLPSEPFRGDVVPFVPGRIFVR